MATFRTQVAATLLIVALTLACGGSIPAPTTIPTITLGADSTQPRTMSTPVFTSAPSQSSAADSRRPVLRLMVYEFPTAVTKIEAPEFTLYADGRVIYTVKTRSTDSTWPTYELHSAQMSPDQATALLAAALDEGGLRDAREEYNIPGGDMGMELEWNYFTVAADGVDKSVRVYGLGHDAAPDPAERARFASLAFRLLDFPAEIESGGATYLGIFEPTAYDAFLHSGVVTEELPVNADWPWPDLDASDFTSVNDETWRRLSGPEGEAVLAAGIDESLIAQAPNGKKYLIRIRPLLPDEVERPGPVSE